MTESELQSAVIQLARWSHWRVFHAHDSRRSTGPGYPDLTLVHIHDGRVMWVELKSATGRLSPEQKNWLTWLGNQHTAVVWTPRDWHDGTIRDALTRPAQLAETA